MMRTHEPSAVVDRVVEAAAKVDAPSSCDPALFERFCAEVSAQLRGPYVSRYGAENIPANLLGLFELFSVRKADAIHARVQYLGGRRVHIRSVMRDQPFIVNTVRLQMGDAHGTYVSGFNAVFRVQRDEDGRVVSIGGEQGELESVVQVEAEGMGRSDAAQASEKLVESLSLSCAMVEDFEEIGAEVERIAAQFDRLKRKHPDHAERHREVRDFLRWLGSDNFVFVGLRHGDVALGFERDPAWAEGLTSGWPDQSVHELPVIVRKGERDAPVHRRGRLDEIRVDVCGSDGQVVSHMYLQGLFTYRALTQPSRAIPVLRQVLSRILTAQKRRPGSFGYKGVTNVFDSLPTEFLFTASQAEIENLVEVVRDAEQEQRVQVDLVQELDSANTTFALAAMPKPMYSHALQRRMQRRLVRATAASYCDHGLFMSRYDTVLLHFYLVGARHLEEEQLEKLHAELRDLVTPWTDRVYDAVASKYGEAYADSVLAQYGAAFPEEYTSRTSSEQAVADLYALTQLTEDRPVCAGVFIDRKGRTNVRLYQLGDVILTDILPVLDNFGLLIIDQFSDAVSPQDAAPANIDTFRLQAAWGLGLEQVVERERVLTDAIEAVFAHKVANDALNRLVLASELPWQDVDLIRAYKGHLRQLGIKFPAHRVREILLAHPKMVRRLVTYFHARFDPDLEGDRQAAMDAAAEQIDAGLRRVGNHDEDVLLRSLYALMKATLRTNFFRDDRVAHYISFKIDHDLVDWIPQPKLKYEVYIHHAEMEGVHLRGGKIARGGIRWSDRVDYRTEILGLATTQMVKNVLIVPEGAKGGFYMKHPPADWGERRAKADFLYTFLARGLLDLTDNIVDGEIVKPPRVVPHDGEDTYLVVAADKGTAHLSDTANRVSREYGFWLDDAFASGGSNGYDHKVCGITARGAWVCVRRHFRELGLNQDAKSFTAVGIGDPSGDVFGNGVIEHPTMKLLAAFNHRHIFLDPTPDPETTYKERKRLFDAAKGWDAYDGSLLSEGGGIYDRQAKSITLSPQAKKMLGALDAEISADSLIRKILRMPVDLWWNGGIGTYVKASNESHRDAGDSTNDNCRVNANEIQARAIGEGGNLGFTQAGRIEYALAGGRLNTDATDNSGGVDMSDHEVNLKILLSGLVAAGALDMEARNTFIEELTDEVAAAVLHNNDVHARQLSLDLIRSANDPFPFDRTIHWVCREGGLSRAQLTLPTSDEIGRRIDRRQGLARPELAVLQAHVKMRVYKELLEADPSRFPGFSERVRAYFPKAVVERYPDAVDGHMLHTAIGMTVNLMEIVGDMGAAFFPSLMELTGRSASDIAVTWLRAADALELGQLRKAFGGSGAKLDGLYRAWIFVANGLWGLMGACLAPGQPELTEGELEDVVRILGRMSRLRPQEAQQAHARRVKHLLDKGVPKALAQRCPGFLDLTVAREIAALQRENGDSDRDAIVRYLAIGQASRLLPTIAAMESQQGSGPWDFVANGLLRSRYLTLLRQLCQKVELGGELRLSVDRAAHRLYWDGGLRGFADTMQSILGDSPDTAAYFVAEERLRASWL